MPFEHGAPLDPAAPLPAIDEELLWIEPAPASMIVETSPEARYAARESVQLAFVTALQHLPASQRAALILRDVLGWTAAECAELLDTTVAALNSALQRGRETLEARRRRPAEPADPDAVARYVRAWETGDVDALAALLHEDVVTSMPPIPGWLAGRDAFLVFIAPRIGAPGAQRVVRADAADEVALAFYRNDRGGDDGAHHAYAIKIVELDGRLIRGVHAFVDPSLFARFGLPSILR
jgi:RNA polymerase sigma-70 factor (ECF subfamily)